MGGTAGVRNPRSLSDTDGPARGAGFYGVFRGFYGLTGRDLGFFLSALALPFLPPGLHTRYMFDVWQSNVVKQGGRETRRPAQPGPPVISGILHSSGGGKPWGVIACAHPELSDIGSAACSGHTFSCSRCLSSTCRGGTASAYKANRMSTNHNTARRSARRSGIVDAGLSCKKTTVAFPNGKRRDTIPHPCMYQQTLPVEHKRAIILFDAQG